MQINQKSVNLYVCMTYVMHDSLTNFHGTLEPIREIVAGGRVYKWGEIRLDIPVDIKRGTDFKKKYW